MDIHNYDKRYQAALRQVQNADIPERNKQLILDFGKDLVLEGASKPTLLDSEQTTITLNGENTGNLPLSVKFVIIAENSEKVVVSYPGSLELELQPGEKSEKILDLQAFTDYTSTTYWLKSQLVNSQTEEILDEKQINIIVNK